jgi:ATP-dependent DNA helicase RecG
MMAGNFLETPIEFLKGVGPQRAEVLKKEANIYTFYDLLQFYPYRYIDRSRFYTISEISDNGAFIQLCGLVQSVELLGEKRGKRLVALLQDKTGFVELIWFQGIKWAKEKLKPGATYVVFGKPNFFKGRVSIPHPEIEELSAFKSLPKFALTGMYFSSERMKNIGLDSKGIHKLQLQLAGQIKNQLPEIFSASILQTFGLLNREMAFKNIHAPETHELLEKAIRRIKFEELFMIQLRMGKKRLHHKKHVAGLVFSKVGDYTNTFYKHFLPFELTDDQKEVIREIRSDFASGKQMNRLLQGDVGSGKTIVALLCMLIANDNGFQSCLMAPTEILATQHYQTITSLLGVMPLRVSLLTGSTSTAARKQIHKDLEAGITHILIGTHALIEDKVSFNNLGFVVIDEQHRFGVEQRSKLWQKSRITPHVLVMTATPIPRTLAMTLYGDLDVSMIKTLPPGRKPIKTIHRYEDSRILVYDFLKQQIKEGRQAYIVYPLIEESEKMDYKDLMDGVDNVIRFFPEPQYFISVVHGRQKPADKDYEMQRFVKGQTNIMIATTVIEVGVNVPNASIMIIESAERFGLSQLHQLRGRVGRGASQSYCVLMTGHKLSNEARIRMETMVRTTDGFEIAETDLKLRGPGDVEGTRQSGLLDLKLADISKDQELVAITRQAAIHLLDNDPELSHPENTALNKHFQSQKASAEKWSRIS